MGANITLYLDRVNCVVVRNVNLATQNALGVTITLTAYNCPDQTVNVTADICGCDMTFDLEPVCNSVGAFRIDLGFYKAVYSVTATGVEFHEGYITISKEN